MHPTNSLAVGQISLGPDRSRFPLFPPKVHGIEALSGTQQYPLEIEIDYSQIRHKDIGAPAISSFNKWSEFLPPLLPKLSLSEGNTPLSEISDLLSLTDTRIFLKDETRNPTLSHKDRLNFCIASAATLSSAPGLIAASTGNHGISTAAYAARANLPCIILVPNKFSINYSAALAAYGALPIPVLPANRFNILNEFVARYGFQPSSNITRFHTGHPFGPEGYKTISYELITQLTKAPDCIVVPTGYGELLFGIAKGFHELKQFGFVKAIPQIFSVEPERLAPLSNAFLQKQPMLAVEPAESRLTSIAVTVNSYRGIWALEISKGAALTVSDECTILCQNALARRGLWMEISSAAAIAAIQTNTKMFSGKNVVVIGTASGVRDPLDFVTVHEVCTDYREADAYLKREHRWKPA